MKRFIKSLVLVTLFIAPTFVRAQEVPSTEGKDFWVTFLRADADSPEQLTLTISAKEACEVTIENTVTKYNHTEKLPGNTCKQIVMARNNCYSSKSETATSTALHVTATKDISLFAGNYRNKSFDAANILPTSALQDEYLIQTYPPSDHENKPQGSHFAIVAVEDGETTIDYHLTAKTEGGKTGAQSVTLKQGQVWYVWTGKGEGDAFDLSGTTVKARKNKKIAVFQGCPHTNVPDKVRNRDHIFSQAMPIAYWGSEFGITASMHRRRDIVAIMAINDGTEVYINAKDGEPRLVHTFDFSQTDKKHYWTFEIGEDIAYCSSKESPYTGQLAEPLIVDSSCFITTSCPVGVHLIMASNRYDLADPNQEEPDSDPALLWISPIEQVIKEINFATYSAGINTHYLNVVTSTANVPNMTWNGNSIESYFRPIMGNEEYSYARLEIPDGKNHNLKGYAGFLAHVYGYGEKASYAYSCGSSTVARSITFNGLPVLIDSISARKFCIGEEIEMKLNIGNNEYETIEWDYGDGVIYSPNQYTTNEEKKRAYHTYETPGWYDLKVSAVYLDPCSQVRHKETMKISFQIKQADTVIVKPQYKCLSLEEQADTIAAKGQAYLDKLVKYGVTKILNPDAPCYEDRQLTLYKYGLETKIDHEDVQTVRDSIQVGGTWYYPSLEVQTAAETRENANEYNCNVTETYRLLVVTTLEFETKAESLEACYSEAAQLPFTYKKGEFGKVWIENLAEPGKKYEINPDDLPSEPGTIDLPLPTATFKPGKYEMRLFAEDAFFGDVLTRDFTLDVFYPADIFKYKFNNVLAVYKPGYGGNETLKAEFTAFQWYKDGEKIEGATESIYQTEGQIPVGEYYVELTDKNGLTIRSCSQSVQVKSTSSSNAAPAQKVVRNNQIYIQVGDILYDVYGQRVQ